MSRLALSAFSGVMVGRQDVGMHRAAKAGDARFQVMEVENVIVLLTEATDYRLVVVSFLLLLPISSLLRRSSASRRIAGTRF